MKDQQTLVLTVKVDDLHDARRNEMVRQTIAQDVAYMLNKNHEDVYRTLTMYVEEEIEL